MGLGKTLQSICILASAHHEHADSKPISLVICPTTVTGHWEHEIRRFVGGDLLKPIVYAGQPAERKRYAGCAGQLAARRALTSPPRQDRGAPPQL